MQLCKLGLQSAGGGVFDDNEIFLRHICAKDKVLLLYDSADLNMLKTVLPGDTARVHVLVTTRKRGDHPVLARANGITSLGRLGPDAGMEALEAWREKALDEVDRMYAKQIVIERPIEGLPIAIAHVATVMKMAGLS